MRKSSALIPLVAIAATLAVPRRATAQSAPVQLESIRHLRKDVDAWPLILNPNTQAKQQINRHIRDLNHQLEKQLRFCDKNLADWKKRLEQDHVQPGEEGDEPFNQTVEVTMKGPAILSLLATGGFFCGTAHPYAFTNVAIFDLRTGNPINPENWLDPSVKASLDTDEDQDPSLEQPISIPSLIPLYRKTAGHDCEGEFPDSQTLLIWPDAKADKVVLQAYGLPGCCYACEIPVGIPIDQARKLGFATAFLQSIRDAHRATRQP